MSFAQEQVEPKNFFLTNLITLFFQTSIDLIQHQNVTQGRRNIRALMAVIPADTEEARNIQKRIANSDYLSLKALIEMFQNEITPYLHNRYFSELQIGVIPTSTLEGKDKKPENEPVNPIQSSRL